MKLKALIPQKVREIARTYQTYRNIKDEYWRFLSSETGSRFNAYEMGPRPPTVLCRKQFPDISYAQNELNPPLNFLSNSSMDFVFAYSVLRTFQ